MVSVHFIACLGTQKWTWSSPPSHYCTRPFCALLLHGRSCRPEKVAETKPLGEDAVWQGALPAQSQEGEVGWTAFLLLLVFAVSFFQAGLRWTTKQSWNEAPPLPAWSASSGYSFLFGSREPAVSLMPACCPLPWALNLLESLAK